jgi:hypothetical protein
MGEGARRLVENDFTLKRQADKYISLYKSVTHTDPRG